MRTDLRLGSENPVITTVSGFFRAIFQGENKKIHLPLFAARVGIELKSKDFRGRNFTNFCEIPAPFSVFKFVKQPLLKKEDLRKKPFPELRRRHAGVLFEYLTEIIRAFKSAKGGDALHRKAIVDQK